MIAGIVLAAGAGTRFGGPKQLAQFRGRPLLEHPLAAMERAAELDRLIVVLGAESRRIEAEVPLHGAEPVPCPEWERGQGWSLRAGIEAVAACDAAVVVLGDQPLISTEAVRRVIAAREGGAPAIRATYGGVAGHPVLLERETMDAAMTLDGDEGARALLRQSEIKVIGCDGLGSDADVDTVEALAALEGGLSPHRPAAGPR